MGFIDKGGHIMFLYKFSDICSKEKYENPWEKREIIGRIERCVIHTKREKDVGIIEKIGHFKEKCDFSHIKFFGCKP